VSDCEELVGVAHRRWCGLFNLVSVNSNHVLVKYSRKFIIGLIFIKIF